MCFPLRSRLFPYRRHGRPLLRRPRRRPRRANVRSRRRGAHLREAGSCHRLGTRSRSGERRLARITPLPSRHHGLSRRPLRGARRLHCPIRRTSAIRSGRPALRVKPSQDLNIPPPPRQPSARARALRRKATPRRAGSQRRAGMGRAPGPVPRCPEADPRRQRVRGTEARGRLLQRFALPSRHNFSRRGSSRPRARPTPLRRSGSRCGARTSAPA